MRAITQGHLEKVGSAAALTYLFLCSVGDTAGLSFWSHERVSHVLGLDVKVIQEALNKLVTADLIARQGQIIQVLPIPTVTTPVVVPDHRSSPRSIISISPGGAARATTTQPVVVPEEPRSPTHQPELTADSVRACEGQAREQIARFNGQREPSASVVQALARSLALKARDAGLT
jgi:hypothetical protein